MAGRIAQDYLAQLLDRVDVLDVVSAHVDLKQAGSNWSGLCPFHQEKTPSFTVSAAKQFYHCFGCGAHGNAIDFVMNVKGLEFPEAVDFLANLCGMPLPEKAHISPAHDRYLGLLEEATVFYQQSLKKAPTYVHKYLKLRGINAESVEHFRLGFAAEAWQNLLGASSFSARADDLVNLGLAVEGKKGRYDRFRNRLMFPIVGSRKQVCGFGGRVLDDAMPKYMNSPESVVFQKSQLLYGVDQLADRHLPCVVMTEGYMDVLMLHQFGFKQAVASLGTSANMLHVGLLTRFSQHVLFCFDSDPAGFKAVIRMLKILLEVKFKEGARYEFLLLPKGQDPDALLRQGGIDAWEKAMDSSRSWLDILVSYVTQKNTLIHSTEQKLVVLKNARSLIGKKTQAQHLSLLAQLLSEKLRWNFDVVKSHLMGENNQVITPPRAVDSFSNGQKGLQVVHLEDRLLAILLCDSSMQVLLKKDQINKYSALVQDAFDLLERLSPDEYALETLKDRMIKYPNLVAWFASHHKVLDMYQKMSQDDRLVEVRSIIEKMAKDHGKTRFEFLNQKLVTQGLSDQEHSEFAQLMVQKSKP